MQLHKQILLLISISSTILSFSAQAICVPRNITFPSLLPEPPEAAEESTKPNKGAVDAELANICKKTENAELCEQTIGPKIGPNEKVTPTTALLKEIEALSEETKLAVKASDDAKASDPGDAKPYRVCSEMFHDSEDDLKTSADAIAANDMPGAKIRLSGALTYFGTCDDTFDEFGKESPISETTARLRKLASNCLAIAAIC